MADDSVVKHEVVVQGFRAMPELATLSNTGEIKLPLRVRTKLGFEAGQKFEVRVEGRSVVLTALGPPSELAVREFLAWKETHPEPDVIQLKSNKKNPSRRLKTIRAVKGRTRS